MDDVDRTILGALQDDARRSNREVASIARISPTTASERTRALITRGVITGATLEVDLAAIGRTVQALVAVRIRPPSRELIEGFRDWAANHPDVLGVFVTSGAEDFILHLAVAGNDALYAFVVDHLTSRREVADVRTSIVYEHLQHRVRPVGAAVAH
jgi:DNA-binding Lrp family transcriptional regulator